MRLLSFKKRSLILVILLLFPLNVQATTYIYDQLSRLTKVTYDNSDYIEYQYDPAGNIVNVHASSSTGVAGLSNAIATLKVLTSENIASIPIGTDANGDGKIGMVDALMILRNVSAQ
jgi:YD repeat-containing protein